MDGAIEDRVHATAIQSDFTKKSMIAALHEGMSLPSLRHGESSFSIQDSVKALGGFIEGWNLHKYSSDSVGVGYAAGSDWNLTKSETKWVIDAIDNSTFDYDDIQRVESPDFLYDSDVGIEVKSNENYSISRKQLQAIAELDTAYIYLVTRTRVERLDTFDWIGMNEYVIDR